MIIYLIRHATPDRNTGMDYHKLPGPPLNGQGEREARELAARLAHCDIQRIYSSPWTRAAQTALTIGAELGLSVELRGELGEWQSDDTEERVAKRVQTLLDLPGRGNVALVSHGWVIRAALRLYGIDEGVLAQHCRRYDTENPLPCAGVWRVRLRWLRKPEMVLL